jgi:hypothetical protein
MVNRFLDRNSWKLAAIRIDCSNLSEKQQKRLLKIEKTAKEVLEDKIE